MLVDTQPATHHHLPASTEVREEWVTSQLIGVVMNSAMAPLLAAGAALPVMLYLMFGQVDHTILVVWVGTLGALLAYRFRIIGQYRLRYDSVEGPMRKTFIDRYGWTWGAVGVLWGASVGITFQQTNAQTQFVTGLVVLGHGIISLAAFSPNLPLFRRYVGGLIGTAIAGLLLPDLLGFVPNPDQQLMVLLSVLLLIFWFLLDAAARRLNAVYRASYELQFSNQELIDSLTQQTRAALRAVATKNRFLASAAHDLRQPVHALSLYADWLASEPEMGRDIAPRILQSTRAINELFDSLFDLTRIDAGNYKVRLQHVDVKQLMTDLAMQFEPVAQGKSLKLRTRAQPSTIWADPVVLRRVLGNLVSNALRHTSQGGVLLALRRREGLLMFEVWDSGVGIAREHQHAIFQEFFRVAQHQGTEDSLGLGLTIVSKLTTLMGYQLALNSIPGRGSVFRVMLPAFTQSESDENSGNTEPIVDRS
jgi:signal transduction histidine kinase